MYFAVSSAAPRSSRRGAGVRWGFLPRSVWTPGLADPEVWQPGRPLAVPRRILVHHANFCVGIDHKLAQLEAVDAVVTGRSGPGRVQPA